MPDEINLIDYIQVLLKRKWIIILGTLICPVVAGVISFSMPKIYRGEATFKVTGKEITTGKEIVSIIGNLDGEKLKHVLPKNYNLVDRVRLSALRDSADKFQLIIEAKRVDDIPIAISEFEEYVVNIPLIKRSVEQEKERLLEQVKELSKVIESSAELAKAYNNLIKTGKLAMVGFNPVELNQGISDMKIKKLQMEQALKRLKGVEMIAQPYISSKPVKPKKRQNVMIAGVVGLLASILVAFFMEFLERNKMNLTKPSQ